MTLPDTNEGTVRVNTVQLDDALPAGKSAWRGRYFEGVAIRI